MTESSEHAGNPGAEPESYDATADMEAPIGEDLPPGESEELLSLRADLARADDRHRRALADLDNYRKRTEREGDRRAAQAREHLLREWLEVFDSVERALRMEPGDPGLLAVLAQMEAILSRHGVQRMDAVGASFDPARFEAISVQPDDQVPDRTVLDIARSGFELGDGTVLRPAQVIVSRRPAPSGST